MTFKHCLQEFPPIVHRKYQPGGHAPLLVMSSKYTGFLPFRAISHTWLVMDLKNFDGRQGATAFFAYPCNAIDTTSTRGAIERRPGCFHWCDRTNNASLILLQINYVPQPHRLSLPVDFRLTSNNEHQLLYHGDS
uniref:Uncharacterized protein n=1 Tax=Compsopogon caeruleus TaxID=31354 RepID=A0A7S1THZ7_9RHOD|mmetsp:Transcript_865/g.1840  ORF Transcript_865/g.1840 Transcript_865/m.1840 type:complete len:135 (+) Transcript_865:69-473(+)